MLTFKYKNVDSLPLGHTSDKVTPGCIVLEGGAFRGVYTSGVLDRLMQADINMDCTIGVSAGAMNGFNYVSGQIGRSGRINLTYRHDPRYIGYRALRDNHGIAPSDVLVDCLTFPIATGQEETRRDAIETIEAIRRL